MEKYVVPTNQGLTPALKDELSGLGIEIQSEDPASVRVLTDSAGLYKIHLYSRLATRVQKPIARFSAKNPEELYASIRELDLSEYLNPQKTFAIDATVKNCGDLRDQRFVAMTAKDAIVDRIRDKHGERPSVDKNAPSVRFVVQGFQGEFEFRVDYTGDALFMRGYRIKAGMAPLKETLAAGLLHYSGWTGEVPLLDFMCGSGTIVIEAALKALNVAPGTLRGRFDFMNFESYDQALYQSLEEQAYESEKDDTPVEIFGSDKKRKMIEAAKSNAKRAGVLANIRFLASDFRQLPAEIPRQCHIITNPPYGERMDDPYELLDLYRDLAHILKTEFGGAQFSVIASSKEHVSQLAMKAFSHFPVKNGPIDCRFLNYTIRKN